MPGFVKALRMVLISAIPSEYDIASDFQSWLDWGRDQYWGISFDLSSHDGHQSAGQ